MNHRAPLALAVAGFVALAPNVTAFADEIVGERAPRIASEAPRPAFATGARTHIEDWELVPEVAWPALNGQALLEDDQLAQAPGVPLRVGVDRTPEAAPITPDSAGLWMEAADGSRIWRLRLNSPGAAAIGVNFARFDLPPGGELRIGSPADPGRVEAFEAMGPLHKGHFNAAPVAGETAYVEYHGPAESVPQVDIEIRSIAHIYRPIAPAPASERDLRLLPCQVDVLCRPVDPNARDAVGRMLFQVGSGYYVCSGSLLADADSNTAVGYFLTANHCISSQDVADTLNVLWFYQTTSCDGSIGETDYTYGATLLANSSATDFSFLRLADDASRGQGMAGWTTTPASGTVYGIHHPGGDFKRYSGGYTTTAAPICGGLPTSAFIYNDWNDGITEGGSSGSPLFNTNWQVVGQLFGFCYYSPPNCSNPQDYNNVYGRFDVSYALAASWLNHVEPDDEYEDNDDFAQSASIPLGAYDLRLVDFYDYFIVNLPVATTLTITATYAEADMDLRVHLYNGNQVLITNSNDSDGSESIVRSLVAGDYYIRMRRVHGWGGDYTLTLSAPCSIQGDLDDDGTVGLADLSALLTNYGLTGGATYADGDLDGDGDVDLADLSALLTNFGLGC
jgi:hypothetical protein